MGLSLVRWNGNWWWNHSRVVVTGSGRAILGHSNIPPRQDIYSRAHQNSSASVQWKYDGAAEHNGMTSGFLATGEPVQCRLHGEDQFFASVAFLSIP